MKKFFKFVAILVFVFALFGIDLTNTCYLSLDTCYLPCLAPVFAGGSDWKPAFFPALGFCTGDGVRLRDEPGTDDSRIIGKVNKFDGFIVLGETSVNGDVWYEIETPIPGVGGLGIDDTLWISGRYVTSGWKKAEQRNPVTRLVVQLNQTFGSTPERSRILLGRPLEEGVDEGDYEGQDEGDYYLKWDGLTLFYSENTLKNVAITSGNWSFGEFKLGDDFAKVRRLLGEPDEGSSEFYPTYSAYSDIVYETLYFESENEDGVITSMAYSKDTADIRRIP